MNENKEKVYILSLGSALDPFVDHFCNEYKMLLKEIGYEVEHIFYQNTSNIFQIIKKNLFILSYC